MDVFPAYEKLWKRAQDLGAVVTYLTWIAPGEPSLTADHTGATGWFRANVDVEGAQPFIDIYRLHPDDEPFSPSRARGPEGASLPPPDLEEELITLAHEYGHLVSFRSATPRPEWHRYDESAKRRGAILERVADESDEIDGVELSELMREALRAELTEDEKARIVHEESLAWDIGREALVDLGITDLSKFEARRRLGLHAHRYRLGLEEAWPEGQS